MIMENDTHRTIDLFMNERYIDTCSSYVNIVKE